MNNPYVIILAGGSGTRLWPLSTKKRPKHLLPFLNNTSLLDQTIQRIKDFTIPEHVGVITAEEQIALIKKYCNEPLGFIFAEPTPRNTAPAILYSCLQIHEKNKDAMLVFLPADHFISDTNTFVASLRRALDHAETSNTIVTLGLMPTYAATGYGYIQADTASTISAGTNYPVKQFHEKPSKEQAEQYLKDQSMLWNLGMFIGKASVFIEEYKKLAPDIFQNVQAQTLNESGYDKAESISIDYAIVEKSDNVSVIPCDFAWNDVGNLHTFLSLQNKYGANTCSVTTINGTNNLAHAQKPVFFIGIENICVIESNEAIVVSAHNEIEQVKEIQKKCYGHSI